MIAQNRRSKSRGRGEASGPTAKSVAEVDAEVADAPKETRSLATRDEDTSAYISPLLTRIPNELVETFHYLVARLAAEDKLPQRIGVVAANHGEGTTTVARLLAAVLVNDLNRSVCLIDVDPRHNIQNTESGEPQAGLFQVLAHDLPVDAAIAPSSDARLHVLRAGVGRSIGAREMLRSSMLETVFDDLSSKFDHVVVDVPPILAGSNSLALMRHVPSYIMVVRHGTTKVDQVASAVSQLATHESLGVVLNNFSTKVPKGLRRFFTA